MATKVSGTHKQGIAFGYDVDRRHGRKLSLKNGWKNANTNYEWQDTYSTYTASFQIKWACARPGGYFYVLGTSSRNGQEVDVIEEWQAVPGDAVMGENPDYEMLRDQVYRDNSLGKISLISADPEGRFLMILHAVDPITGIGVLSKMGLGPAHQVSVVDPAIADVRHMKKVDHQDEGRMWMLTSTGMRFVTALFDQDNDGAFENTMTFDYDTWVSLDYTSGVVDDFVFE